MRQVRVSAPGKAILHGEHAVVFGKAALAVSLDIRSHLSITEDAEDSLIVSFPDLRREYRWSLSDLRDLKRSLAIASTRSKPVPAESQVIAGLEGFVNRSSGGCPSINNNNESDMGAVAILYLYLAILNNSPPLHITLTSDIPIGSGLGSSAAMSVCFAGGLLEYSKQVASDNHAVNGNGTATVNGHNGHLPHNGQEAVVATNGQNSHVTGHLNGRAEMNGNGNSNGHANGGQSNGTSETNLTEVDQPAINKQLICDWAFVSEKIMHGTPSGIDNSVSTFGGVVLYRSGQMTPISDICGLNILLVNTNVPKNTRELVAGVRSKYQRFPKVMGPLIDSVDHLAMAALQTMQMCSRKAEEDCRTEFNHLEELIDMNHSLLGAIGVSHPSLERVIQINRSHNIHSKLTGAGGGGFALGLITPYISQKQVDSAILELERDGFTPYQTQIGGKGVRIWSSPCHK